ncbi:hypothetical protein [Candidatus Williamhamiltonella defendens]|uniref:hypothetical protein n=1 Tax=Candidatus Williamhamiltonella defendens TaxID=138072 RepID=UPI0002F73769|nr:hypothetical protein [Candidatus Hamiltonella defensa]
MANQTGQVKAQKCTWAYERKFQGQAKKKKMSGSLKLVLTRTNTIHGVDILFIIN